jgi:(S)-ureidoglycine aminohydrolase
VCQSELMSGTRGTRGQAFTLLTPENHYASRLPSLPGAAVYKLVTPRLIPARFGQYLLDLPDQEVRAEVEPGFESFFFGLTGTVTLGWEGERFGLDGGDFAYLPASTRFVLDCVAGAGATLLWIKRRYAPWPGLGAPEACVGTASEVIDEATATPGLRRRELLPREDPRFDFNMSLMWFDPGVSLPQVEIHDEEHGLYMTAGGGVYALDDEVHEVREGDFIYMAPYCPQGFAAGPGGAEYLLYKDVYRDGF